MSGTLIACEARADVSDLVRALDSAIAKVPHMDVRYAARCGSGFQLVVCSSTRLVSQ